MTAVTRPTLGSFMNLTCFHYLRQGAEDTAGRALVVSAGRQRGFDVAEALDLLGSTVDPEEIRKRLDTALGSEGTRLCLVNSVKALPNGGYEVRIKEGACTAGISSQEPYCAFTLGVFVGAISAISGKRMMGRETQCEAMGKPECVYLIEPLG